MEGLINLCGQRIGSVYKGEITNISPSRINQDRHHWLLARQTVLVKNRGWQTKFAIFLYAEHV